MAQSTAVQMNIRIDRALKDSGDAVLARIGITPSQAVRALWQFITRHAASPDQVEQFVAQAQARDLDQADPLVRERLAILQRGWLLCEGIDIPSELANQSYEQLREEAYLERFGEGIA